MGRYSLNGQVGLVTGAARGIGAATARALHARGASVALVDLQAPDAFDAERTLGLAADVTDREVIGQAVEASAAPPTACDGAHQAQSAGAMVVSYHANYH